jgi:LemA protein
VVPAYLATCNRLRQLFLSIQEIPDDLGSGIWYRGGLFTLVPPGMDDKLPEPMKTLPIIGIIVAIIVILLVAGCGSYNNLVSASQDVDAKWAQVQNVYQRRADLIPNLVNTVQGAANFEKQTLTEVTQARQQVNNVKVDPNTAPTDPAQLERFQQSQDALSSALSRLLVVVERYPELKANANFTNLQTQLEGTENRIAVERGRFNESVQSYNTKVKTMPTALFAGMMGFHPKPYFEAAPGAETPPPVNFHFGSPAPAAR